MMRSATLCLAVLALASCARGGPAGDPAVLAAAKASLEKRLAVVRDYSFEGTAQLTNGAQTAFTYAFMQPAFAKATLGTQQSVVFDGTMILALNHEGKTFMKVDKSIGDEEFLLALHGAFSDFACEGWRPPLVKPNGTIASVSADGSQWILTTTLDDATLKENLLVLRAKDGAFLERRTIDRQGNTVALTRVLEELDDPATGLKLPKRWQRTGPAGSLDLSLGRVTVNGGIAREAFLPTIPEGYKPGS